MNALNNAKDSGHTQVTPSHLVLAMLEDDEFHERSTSMGVSRRKFSSNDRSDLKLPTQNPPPPVGPSTALQH